MLALIHNSEQLYLLYNSIHKIAARTLKKESNANLNCQIDALRKSKLHRKVEN